MNTVRLGSAIGWSRDRFGPAEELAKQGQLDYLCFEAMSEVTQSEAQVKKQQNPESPGYDPYLEDRLRPVLRTCLEKGTRIITNQGWIEPIVAAEKVIEIARAEGIEKIKVAAIEGGFLTDKIADMGLNFLETGEPIADYRENIVSAEAYLGAGEISEALGNGTNIVITARVADSCLYLGPLAYEFNWSIEDWNALAKGTVIGHLMECACQISGGYFADPGYKDVPDLSRLGHPIAEVSDNKAFITKLPNTGGLVSMETCKEQLLYEVQDPANYICPDLVADFTTVKFRQAGKDRVEVVGGTGKPRTPTLKVVVGVKEGYIAEEMVLFAGPGALSRAELAKSILRERFHQIKLQAREMRMDYVGINSIHREATPESDFSPYEIILRVAIKTDSIEEAGKLRREIDPMAVNGPSATGKWAPMGNRVRPIVGFRSTLVPREEITTRVVYRQSN